MSEINVCPSFYTGSYANIRSSLFNESKDDCHFRFVFSQLTVGRIYTEDELVEIFDVELSAFETFKRVVINLGITEVPEGFAYLRPVCKSFHDAAYFWAYLATDYPTPFEVMTKIFHVFRPIDEGMYILKFVDWLYKRPRYCLGRLIVPPPMDHCIELPMFFYPRLEMEDIEPARFEDVDFNRMNALLRSPYSQVRTRTGSHPEGFDSDFMLMTNEIEKREILALRQEFMTRLCADIGFRALMGSFYSDLFVPLCHHFYPEVLRNLFPTVYDGVDFEVRRRSEVILYIIMYNYACSEFVCSCEESTINQLRNLTNPC